jgi:hypothetical protein
MVQIITIDRTKLPHYPKNSKPSPFNHFVVGYPARTMAPIFYRGY